MSPLRQDQQHQTNTTPVAPGDGHEQYSLGCKADGAQDIDFTMMALGAAEGQLRDARREVAQALLAGVLYCGLTTSELAEITGWSRRTCRRRLREADPWAHGLR